MPSSFTSSLKDLTIRALKLLRLALAFLRWLLYSATRLGSEGKKLYITSLKNQSGLPDDTPVLPLDRDLVKSRFASHLLLLEYLEFSLEVEVTIGSFKSELLNLGSNLICQLLVILFNARCT